MSNAGFKATWLGDEDPQSQIVQFGDLVFIKGQSVNVPDKHGYADLIRGNPAFSTEGKAEPVEVAEPSEDEQRAKAEEGTEKAALKDQLRNYGVSVQGNPSVETLRAKLAEAAK